MRRIKTPRPSLERLLIAQADDYSCGPACLATVACLCGEKNLYEFFCRHLSPKPGIGSHPLAMMETARRHLPLESAGEKTYGGGLGIAYILHQDTQAPAGLLTDHYVVFLAQEKNDLFYFDPWDSKIYYRDIEKIIWRSTYRWPNMAPHIERWSLNFQSPEWLTPGLCRKLATPHPH